LLKVDYQEKQYAQGVIPNTFMRREGAPKERELLVGRLIDRPIRPLFPAGFYHEVQVCHIWIVGLHFTVLELNFCCVCYLFHLLVLPCL